MNPIIAPSRLSQRVSRLAFFMCGAFTLTGVPAQFPSPLSHPVMFVTQVPVRPRNNNFNSFVTSVGGNHLSSTMSAPRGGDLYIHYPTGNGGFIKNLTRTAGYGEPEPVQGARGIAVRDPHIHWSGQRAVFSMVVGDWPSARWQLYEVTGLGQNDTPVISIVPHQSETYNNVQPCYASNENIIFVSDRPRDGSAHLYPAIDEKGQGEINTGVWQLNPVTGSLTLMEHSPSGSFDPLVDSYGRVLFSRWDHLQRDELIAGTQNSAGGFDYAGENATATGSPGEFSEIFPDPLQTQSNPFGLKFDQFLPWTINQDGTDLVTINHLGRHEMTLGFNRSRPDSNLVDFVVPSNPNNNVRATSFLQITEIPTMPGQYVTTDAIFTAVSAGKVLSFTAPPTRSPATGANLMVMSNSGLARDPSILSNNKIMVSFSPGQTAVAVPLGNSSYGSPTGSGGGGGGGTTLPATFIPNNSSPFKIKVTNAVINAAVISFSTAPQLNPNSVGVSNNWYPSRTVSNMVNGTLEPSNPTNVTLWELQPVEVRPVTRPAAPTTPMDAPEFDVFTRAGVSPTALREWMKTNSLALISCRNVTSRDAEDKQQPISLKVDGGVATVAPGGGPVYTVNGVQFFQADYVRGYGLSVSDNTPDPGRRVTARVMHEDKGANPVTEAGPGSVTVQTDGSMAAFVPAQRGLAWQLTDAMGDPIVRERYWLSFQAGEFRACTSCHGVNDRNQANQTVSTNPPLALSSLLASWKQGHPEASASAFRVWTEATLGATLDPEHDADSDGVSNFQEYAYGSPPLTAATSGDVFVPLKASQKTLDGHEYSTLTFTRALDAHGLAMTVESSPDMTAWSEAAYFGPEGQRVSADFELAPPKPLNSGRAQEVQLTDLRSANIDNRRYYRLHMSSP